MNKITQQIPTLTSGEFSSLMAAALERDLKGWKDQGFMIRVYGVLGNLEAQRDRSQDWAKMYGITLNADGPININGRKSIFDPFMDGDMVEVVGYPTINVFQSRVTVQLEVLSARFAEGESEQAVRREMQGNLAALASLRPTRNLFPLSREVTVDVIHSSASAAQVDEDFYNGVGDRADQCLMNSLPVRITSAQAIAEAIHSSQADILVIIRGGGPESDFAAFNDAEVLKALSEKKSYRVVGLGHSANTTLVDLIADYSASVPAEAGAHIRTQLAHLDGLVKEFEDAADESEETIGMLRMLLSQEREQAKKEKQQLLDSLKSQAARPEPKAKSGDKWMWLAIVVLVLLLIFK